MNEPPVVTGFGVASCLGVGAEAFWSAVQAGTDGAKPVRSFDTTGLRNQIGCEVDPALLDGALEPGWSELPRATRLAAVAANEALGVAGLEATEIDDLWVGTTSGDWPEVEARLAAETDPAATPPVAEVLNQNFAAGVGDAVGFSGPAHTAATACSAGNVGICQASDAVRRGRVSRALAGGADAFSRLAFIGFSRMRGMAPERCTPFAAGRKGMLLGEGAAFLVIESAASARQRGARVYAAVRGHSMSCDAFHVAAPPPDGRGAVHAMKLALESADVPPEEIDYVSAHGTGTVQNDRAEAQAIRNVFGRHQPHVSSLKALTGHPLAAASALEAVAAVLSLRDQRLIPAWHVESPDPQCDVRLPLPGATELERPLRLVLSNAFAFGGNNSCLVLEEAH